MADETKEAAHVLSGVVRFTMEDDPTAPRKPRRPFRRKVLRVELPGWAPQHVWNGAVVFPEWKDGRVVALRIHVERLECPLCGTMLTAHAWDIGGGKCDKCRREERDGQG